MIARIDNVRDARLGASVAGMGTRDQVESRILRGALRRLPGSFKHAFGKEEVRTIRVLTWAGVIVAALAFFGPVKADDPTWSWVSGLVSVFAVVFVVARAIYVSVRDEYEDRIAVLRRTSDNELTGYASRNLELLQTKRELARQLAKATASLEKAKGVPPAPEQQLNKLRAACDSTITSGKDLATKAAGARSADELEIYTTAAHRYFTVIMKLLELSLHDAAFSRESKSLMGAVEIPLRLESTVEGRQVGVPVPIFNNTNQWLMGFRERAKPEMLRLDY
jgi:hypothetical protein